MITDQAYSQYCQAQKSLEEREARAKAEAAKMADPKYSEEVRMMLTEGNDMLNISVPVMMRFRMWRFRQRFPG